MRVNNSQTASDSLRSFSIFLLTKTMDSAMVRNKERRNKAVKFLLACLQVRSGLLPTR